MRKFNSSEVTKGQCFYNVFSFISNNGNEKDLKVVHGLIVGRGKIEGVIHGHSWVEFIEEGIEFVFDPSYGVTIPKVIYLLSARCKYSKYYTISEYIELCIKEGHSGPFTKEMESGVYNV